MKLISKWFRNNLALKILSIFIAIVIWYVVVENNDPIITRSYTVKVKVVNETYIQSGKKNFTIDNAYKNVTVFIKGNRSILKNVNTSSIFVTADLTQIVSMDTTPVMVPLTATCNGINQENITLSRTAIPISIENMASKEFPITVDTGDSIPGKEYEIGSLKPNPEQVILRGPESIINKIDSVVAQIDVTGMTMDGTKKAKLKLIDKNQTEISQSTIDDDISFDGGTSEINVQVELWKKQSDVSLQVEYSGQPAAGYQVTSISTTPETITVAGKDEAIQALLENHNQLTVPKKYISIAGAKKSVTKEISLKELLPSNMKLSSNTTETISVTITILPEGSREFDVDVDSIVTTNVAKNLTVTYDQKELTIQVNGELEAVKNMTSGDISASLDFTGKGEGDYNMPVSIVLPNGVKQIGTSTISVHLKKGETSK